jgi:hypothetical protein
MNPKTTRIASEVNSLVEAVGLMAISPLEALSKLDALLKDSFDFRNLTALWQAGNVAAGVLAELLPERASIFCQSQSGPADSEKISEDLGAKMAIREIMCALELFDTNGTRKQGAIELLQNCPNPIPKSDMPFQDARGTWGHTHKKP